MSMFLLYQYINNVQSTLELFDVLLELIKNTIHNNTILSLIAANIIIKNFVLRYDTSGAVIIILITIGQVYHGLSRLPQNHVIRKYTM